jgi:CrcB protein
MGEALLVGMGGFIGTVLRYAIGGWIGRAKSGAPFPLETLLINVAGCLVIGVLAGLSETRGALSETTRAFLFIGVLGGFTTFSAFGYETFQLIRIGLWPAATISAAIQLLLGIGAVWIGHALAAGAR